MICFRRYREVEPSDPLVMWLWSVLESFTNEERILFMRFVSGRSRLPTNASDISQRFQIVKVDRVRKMHSYFVTLRKHSGDTRHHQPAGVLERVVHRNIWICRKTIFNPECGLFLSLVLRLLICFVNIISLVVAAFSFFTQLNVN